MSEATRAKSAKARATIAARMLKRGGNLGRAFDDCFEMNDGDQVAAILAERAQSDVDLARELVRRWLPESTLHQAGLRGLRKANGTLPEREFVSQAWRVNLPPKGREATRPRYELVGGSEGAVTMSGAIAIVKNRLRLDGPGDPDFYPRYIIEVYRHGDATAPIHVQFNVSPAEYMSFRRVEHGDGALVATVGKPEPAFPEITRKQGYPEDLGPREDTPVSDDCALR